MNAQNNSNLKIEITGKIVRKFKETAKNGKDVFYVAIEVSRGEWCDTFKLRVKDPERLASFKTGDYVTATAYVGSREWTSPKDGKIAYFVSLTLNGIVEATAPAANEDNSADLLNW